MPKLKNARLELYALYVSKGMTQTAAYKKAGYAGGGSKASETASHAPGFRERVSELIDEEVVRQARSTELALQRLSVTKERVLEGLANLAFSNMKDYIQIDDDGRASIDLSCLSDAQAAAISAITVDETIKPGRKGKDGKPDGKPTVMRKTTFKLHDKRQPLVDLGKHLGMFNDKIEHTVSQSLADLVIASYKKPKAATGE